MTHSFLTTTHNLIIKSRNIRNDIKNANKIFFKAQACDVGSAALFWHLSPRAWKASVKTLVFAFVYLFIDAFVWFMCVCGCVGDVGLFGDAEKREVVWENGAFFGWFEFGGWIDSDSFLYDFIGKMDRFDVVWSLSVWLKLLFLYFSIFNIGLRIIFLWYVIRSLENFSLWDFYIM